jgi:hypothetical protein
LDTIVPDKLPPHIRAQIEDFKRKATHNEALSKEYRDNYDRIHTPNQPTYEQWLKDNGKQKMAKGGKANLKKYLSDSKIRERVYHATPENFSEFKPGGNDPRMSGKAIWTSTDPKRQPASHNIHTRGGNYKQGTNVMPLHVKAKNPLMLDDPTMIDWAQKVFAGGSREFPELLHPHHIDEVRKEGYDSIVLADPHKRGDAHEVIVFEPHQLKSAIGNRGTYDPNEPDITKAGGGDVSLKEMRDYIANQGGVYEGRRFERASDEVPNLMKMYKADALKGLFTGDNARGLMTMNPADFEKYAMPITEDAASNRGYRKNWHDTDVLNHEQYIKHLARLRGFESVPYLDVDKRMSGVRENPFIAGHEGRHRSRALAHKGVEKSLVQFIPRAELREGFPRREREPYIDAIRHELSLTGNRVNPEKEKEFKYDTNKPTPRSSIILPDVYAEGGDVQGKTMTPDLAKMRIELAQNRNPIQMDSIGVNEAMDVEPKVFMSPTPLEDTKPSVGGTQVPKLGPMGGIDMNPNQPGQQLMPAPQQAPGGSSSASASPSIPQGPTPPMGNMLSMTPQGQAMQAMGEGQPQPQSMASGGRAKPKFAIAPAKAPAPTPEHFTPYDHENPTMGSLAKAFDEAIAHHLSLHPESRAANSIRASEALAEYIGRNSNNGAKDLLGKNAKLIKSEKGEEEAIKLPDGRGVETTGLALAPAFEKGKFNTCPNSHSCKAECLGKTSGNYFKLGGGQDLSEFKGPRLNSLRKTLGFIHDPHSFAVKLHDEISDAKAIAAQNNNHLGVRLNVLSDINPRVHKSIIEAHPDVTFYDYTKNNTDPIAPNHHYTYSSTGVSQHGVDNPHSNWKQMRRRLNGGDNVAMAFTHKEHLPEYIHDEETGKKYRVVNGDTHDFHPLDLQPEGEEGVIVGLKNKKATGKMNEAHLDSNGFFVHYDPALKMAKSEKTGSTVYAKDKKGNTIAQNKDVRIKPQTGGMIPITNDDGGKA